VSGSGRGATGRATIPFQSATSAIICGSPGALLSWIALGFAQANPGGYRWTDVRMPEQQVDPADPLAQGRVPTELLQIARPDQMQRGDPRADGAVRSLLKPDEATSRVRQLLDFLRLPQRTQQLIASTPEHEPPVLLVLSNAHRIAAQYPFETVGPLVQAIVGSGVSLLLTFADEPPKGRLAFENIWLIQGGDRSGWRSTHLRVEKSGFGSPFRAGAELPLSELRQVAPFLPV
jgi:hypothetical protein